MINLSSLALAAVLADVCTAFSVPSSLTTATKPLALDITAKVQRYPTPTHSIPRSILYSSLSDDKQKDEVSSGDNDDFVAQIFEPKDQLLGEAIEYEKLTIGVTKETFPGENRVSLSPTSVELLVKAGFHVVVQAGGESSQE